MTLTWSILLLLSFAFMMGSALVVLSMRVNAQIKRFQDSPTPAESFRVLADLQQADDLLLHSLTARVSALETANSDLYRLSRKEQARDAAQKRRDNDVTLSELVEELKGEQDEAPAEVPTLTNFDQNTQSEVDYR